MNSRTQNKIAKPAVWAPDVLERIVTNDDLKIAPYREDGMHTGTPTWIWCVAVDGKLFVRAYSGRSSRWYRAALRQRAGLIVTGGETREVRLKPGDDAMNIRVDSAYRAKYRDSQYLAPMVSDGAREATVQILPAADLSGASR